jgi:uncharacterized protein (DUF3820 family)
MISVLEAAKLAMPFGAYKDDNLCDIPKRYLQWLLDQDWFDKKYPELCEAVGVILNWKEKYE